MKKYKSKQPALLQGIIEREKRAVSPACFSHRNYHPFSNRLIFMFKIVEGLVPAIPPSEFLKPVKERRQVKVKRFEKL